MRLTILRDGDQLSIDVKIGAAPLVNSDAGQTIARLEGASLTDLPANHPASGNLDGVLVQNVRRGSPAYALGLRTGDIITALNRRPVTSLEEFERLAKRAGGRALALNIWRDGLEMFIIVR